MWTDARRLATLLLTVWTSVALGAAPVKLLFQAEDLARQATITGGGDLLVIAAPEDGRLTFSGGKALTFVPRGKGACLELALPVPQAGIYRLVVHGVAGPSCGIYEVLHQGGTRGSFNLSAERAVVRRGLRSDRMLLSADVNRIAFRCLQQGIRGSCLVLDALEWVRHTPPAAAKPDPYDTAIPPLEQHGLELVVNGGFEQFTPYDNFKKRHQRVQNWQFNSAVPTATEVIVRDAARAHSGKQAICLKPDPLDDHAILYQTLRAVTGKRYRVSFYARGTGQIRVDFYQYGGKPSHTDAVRTVNTFDLTSRWRLYSFVMSPSRSGNVQNVAIALHGVTPGAACFDDISVREAL